MNGLARKRDAGHRGDVRDRACERRGALAHEGARLLISGRNGERGAELVSGIEAAGGIAKFVHADLASAGDVRDLAARVTDLDVLVNNAGVYPGSLTHELPESVFDEVFAVNVKAPFLLTASVASRMVERGGGTIINVTTMAAEVGMAGLGVYGASKATVALLTKALGGRVRPARSPRQHGLARPHEYARHGGVYRPEPTNLELAKESA